MYLGTIGRSLSRVNALGSVKQPGVLNGAFARYNIYESKDGRFFALGALETKFFVKFLGAIGLDSGAVMELDEGEMIRAVADKVKGMHSSQLNRIVSKHFQIC